MGDFHDTNHDTKRKPRGHQDSGPQPTAPKSVKAQEREQIIPTLPSYMEVP